MTRLLTKLRTKTQKNLNNSPQNSSGTVINETENTEPKVLQYNIITLKTVDITQIKFKTTLLKSRLCNNSDGYILKGTISVANKASADATENNSSTVLHLLIA